MATGDWIITITGGLIGCAGLALLAWALLADRLRTRRPRRDGALRRCPRCWYDMRAVAGLRCPECGRNARRERSLRRSRRRWRIAAGAVLMIAAGAGAIDYPRARAGAWKQWIPTAILIECIPYAENGWATEELCRRLGLLAPYADPAPFHLSQRRWALLIEASIKELETPARAADPLAVRWAATLLEQRLLELSPEQLARVQAAAGVAGWTYPGVDMTLPRIHGVIAARSSPRFAEQLASAEHMKLDPEFIAAALQECSLVQMSPLWRRLGLALPPGRGSFPVANGPLDPSHYLRAERIDLNSDGAEDCLIHVSLDPGWEIESIVFLRCDGSWRCLGKLPYCGPNPPNGSRLLVGDRPRWLVRRDAGQWTTATKVPAVDTWYRFTPKQIHVDQRVSLGPYGAFVTPHTARRLLLGLPDVARVAGRHAARYTVTATAELRLPLPPPDGGEWQGLVWERTAQLDFGLGPDPAGHGKPLTANPWDGMPVEWPLVCSDAELLNRCAESIRRIMREGGPDLRRAVRYFLGDPRRSDALRPLREALKGDL